MTSARDLLHERLAASRFAALGVDVESDDAGLLRLVRRGVDLAPRFSMQVVPVPALSTLRIEGRWVEASVPSMLRDDREGAAVVLLFDDTSHAAWALRDELLRRATDAPRSIGDDDAWQARFSVFSGFEGFGLHRLVLTLVAAPMLAALDRDAKEGDGTGARLRTLLRRFIDDGESFETSADDAAAAGTPAWFVELFGLREGDRVRFVTPAFVERKTIELRTSSEAMTLRDCPMTCLRGGRSRSTWNNDDAGSAIGVTLQIDHGRNALEVRLALRGVASTAMVLAGAARFVWRFAQGGRLTIAPAGEGTGVAVTTVFPSQTREPISGQLIEALEALADIERRRGVRFTVDTASLQDPAEAEAVRDLLSIRACGRIERTAASMRIALPAGEVLRLLAGNGFQRRVVFRMPPARASRTVLGVTLSLGLRTQEVCGSLVQAPRRLRALALSVAPEDPVDIELNALELSETYEPLPADDQAS